MPLYGEGANVRDWLHVDDHCRGIHLVLADGRPGEVYNIGGGTELTNKELTGLLLEATGTDWDRVEQVTDRLATTCATPSTSPRSATSSATARRSRSSRASPTPSSGTAPTALVGAAQGPRPAS